MSLASMVGFIPKKAYLVIGILVINIILLSVFLNIESKTKDLGEQADLIEITKHTSSTDNLRLYLKKLAQKKSPEHAFSVLAKAQLPPQSDIHLLAHSIGDVLYRQRGAEGITICTQDFRNACSHSIVVGFLMEKGPQALTQIADICRKAPGGPGAYTMCFHGLGHGVLAYTGYDFAKTANLCKETGTLAYGHREEAECVGGAAMEIISGGDHDKELWKKKNAQYVSITNPLTLCNYDYIQAGAREMCLLYLTPHLLTAAGANLGYPSPTDYEKAFEFCNLLDKSDTAGRASCYGGFGKDFIVLVQNRDIRKLEGLTDNQLKTIVNWCELAKIQSGIDECLKSALNSLYWGGENEPDVAIKFCLAMSENQQKMCIKHLTGAVKYYAKSSEYYQYFCKKLPSEYRFDCAEILWSE